MFPLCSAVVAPSPIPFHVGATASFPLSKVTYNMSNSRVIRTNATSCMHSVVTESPEHSCSLDSSILSPYPNEFEGFTNDYFDTESERLGDSTESLYRLYPINEEGSLSIDMSESIRSPSIELELELDLPGTLDQSSIVVTNTIAERPVPITDTFEVANKGLSSVKENVEHLLSGISGSAGTQLDRAEGVVKSTYSAFTLTASNTFEKLKEPFDNVISGLFSVSDRTKVDTADNLTSLSSKLQENMSGAGVVAVDLLRRTIVTLEGSIANGATFVGYSYGSVKSFLPLNVRDALNLFEGEVTEILRPFGDVCQQIYISVQGFERTLGLDPSDPIVPFILIVGSSATIGTSLWLFKYGGYSGDLAPEMTLELLKNDKHSVLIDVRPEDSRITNGIPDLRRGTRYKYACVTLPEMDGSLRKTLKAGKEIDDALTAVVIRNLKLVQDVSKVVIMDDSGGRSKNIARFLKKLGVKKPYLVQGGFQAWVKSGLRIKELKPETPLSVLNEEAEAILEDIKPTPALVIGYSLGITAAIYALLEWEKTLQVIGIIGLVQTFYRRVASYQNSEDLKQDMRLLLVPVKVGAEAFTWAARKLEPNKVGLPTSPSSTAVQDRVLQAAAKHESQPSDSADLSEA